MRASGIGMPTTPPAWDDRYSDLQPLVLGLGDGAAASVLQRAEVAAERHLLLVGELLVVEHEHGVAIHARLDRRDFVTRERPADVDSRDLAHEHGVDLADGYVHVSAPLAVPARLQ